MWSNNKRNNILYWNAAVTLLIIVLAWICSVTHMKKIPVLIEGFVISVVLLVIISIKANWGSRKILYISISVLYCLFVMCNGAFLNIYWRFFMDVLAYIAFGLYLLRTRKSPVTFGESYLLLFLPQFSAVSIYCYCHADNMMYPLILAPVLAMLLLYILYKGKTYAWLRWAGSALILVLSAFWLYPNYFNRLIGKEVAVSKVIDARIDLPLITEQGDTTSISRLGNKIVVLDMWMTRCGVCFHRFPEFDQLYNMYANDPDVYCAAVNLPLAAEVNTREAFEAVSAYSFHKLKSLELAQEGNKWGLIGFPKTFIFDKQHRLRYEGYTNIGKYTFSNNTLDLIERLKKE